MHHLEPLNTVLMQAKQKVETGALYFHYSSPDQTYRVLSLALDEVTEEPCVIYQALYGNQLIWVRTVKTWCDHVEHQGLIMTRFTKISCGT